MIKIMKQGFDDVYIRKLLERSQFDLQEVNETVEKIISDVKNDGDAAVKKYTLAFDKVDISQFRIDQQEIDAAFLNIDKKLLSFLEEAKKNITAYHQKQLIKSYKMIKENGSFIEQIVSPISSVGLYVPGGTASYPSTVLMNAVPAKIAGVKKIVMITPPTQQNKIKDSILVAAKIAGVDEIYQVGGAQGIAALAYGTKQIPKVDKIVGPGNIYVAVAKKMVSGYVGIDMIAGPSEIAIIADETANPKYLAADMMSQAEHDVLAASILVTPSEKLGKLVAIEIDKQIKNLSRKDIIEASLNNYGGIIITKNIKEAVDMINLIAPEHLEIMTENSEEIVPQIKHAGAIFLGAYTPEPVGDYFAGPNHTLPTSGTARFESALSTLDFLKKTSVVKYSKKTLFKDAEAIIGLAEEEGLDAHAHAIKIRIQEESNEL
jgi:histidinol dehydrogenase